jgi:hypothetical protein
VLLNLLRAALCLAFWLAASTGQAGVLYLSGAMIGAAAVVLPLRRLHRAMWSAVIAWSVLCLVVGIFSGSRPAVQGAVALAVTLALATLVLIHLASLAWVGGPARVAEPTPASHPSGIIAAFLAIAAMAAPIWLVSSLWLESLSLLGAVMGIVVLVAGVLAFAAVAVAGIRYSAYRVRRDIDRLLRVPDRPAPLNWRLPQRPARTGHANDFIDQIGRAFATFLYRASQALVVTLSSSLHMMRLFLYAVVLTLCAAVNLLHELWVRFYRRLVAAVREAASIALTATRIVVRSFVHTTRVVLLPLVMMALAAMAIGVWADAALAYTVDGTAVALGRLALTAAIAVTLLMASWMALSGRRLRTVLVSGSRTLSLAGANGLILLALGGWALGMLGIAGGGPIRIGWLTVGSTLILVFAAIWSRVRGHRTVTASHP